VSAAAGSASPIDSKSFDSDEDYRPETGDKRNAAPKGNRRRKRRRLATGSDDEDGASYGDPDLDEAIQLSMLLR